MASSVGNKGPLVLFTFIVLAVLILIIIIAYRYRGSEVKSSSATGCSRAGPPTSIRAVSFQLQNIRVTWNADPFAVRYKVFVGSIPGVTEATSFQNYITSNTEIVIQNLVIGRPYYIRIKSINACAVISDFSEEVSTRLGFPALFRIVNRNQPTLGLKVAPNFIDIILAPFCSGSPGDTLCIWTYDESTGFIKSVDTPNVCMRTLESSRGIGLIYDSCSDLITFGYETAYGIWNYTPDVGSLCNPNTIDGISCLKIDSDNTTVIKAPFDGSEDMQWDIVEYIPPP